jgi:hypothetical protein
MCWVHFKNTRFNFATTHRASLHNTVMQFTRGVNINEDTCISTGTCLVFKLITTVYSLRPSKQNILFWAYGNGFQTLHNMVYTLHNTKVANSYSCNWGTNLKQPTLQHVDPKVPFFQWGDYNVNKLCILEVLQYVHFLPQVTWTGLRFTEVDDQ